jgi:hypothetical protein
MADGEDAQFAVIPTIVREIQRIIAEKLRRILKIKPAPASVMARLTGS